MEYNTEYIPNPFLQYGSDRMTCPYCGISLKVVQVGNSSLYFCYMCGHSFDRDDVEKDGE